VAAPRPGAIVLDFNALTRAIDIQQRSYRLLRWVAAAVDDGRLAAGSATQHADGPAAAIEWVRRYHSVFPRDIQVGPDDVDALATFFWTYVVTSFDVVIEPGSRGAFGSTGCTCELCVRLVDASHLKAKKLRAYDKRRAVELMAERTVARCSEHHLAVGEATVRSFLEVPNLRRAMAYSAYGASLLARVRGETEGPAVLALWRAIAWTRSGAPIKGFVLDAADIVESEERILDAVRGSRG